MTIKILQSSDWHLGAPVLPPGVRTDSDLLKRREAEEQAMLDKLVQTALDEEVELVLLPGDLWDQEQIEITLVRKVLETLGKLAPIPVIIVPGNHDFLSDESPYRPAVVSRAALAWPDNVQIVTSREFTQAYLPGRSDVSYTAMATGANVQDETRLLKGELPRSAAPINILLFHGSREFPGGGYGGKGLVTAPFSAQELLAQDFTYAALGHYHSHSTIEDASGRIRAMYSGSPFARSFRDSGVKGAFVFEVDEAGVVEGSLKRVALDTRRYLEADVDLTGCKDDTEAGERIRGAVRSAGARLEDLIRIHLTGAYRTGDRWKPTVDLSDLVTAVDWRTNRLRPAFDLDEAIRQSTSGGAQAVYLQRMKTLIEEAKAQDPPEAEEVRELETAAMVGYEAFMGRTPPLHIEPTSDAEQESIPPRGSF